MKNAPLKQEYDYIVIGSGFGGSVSALRLSEKGYSVLVVEKGQWYSDASYASTNWNLKRWLWMPSLGLRGIMKVTFFRHVNVLSGVGVGGGSLTYGATLPTPKRGFFESGSWANLRDWESTLTPYYKKALKMLGATDNPNLTDGDLAVQQISANIGKEEEFHRSKVGIFFSDKKQSAGTFVSDPYFNGKGPSRRGCIECASCMTGCRHNAKNTLDKNYLYLAQNLGAQIVAETEVCEVRPSGKADGGNGYFISLRSSHAYGPKNQNVIRAKGVIFSGGVMGSIPLMLKLKNNGSLPFLSEKLGDDIRTNNETLTAVTSFNKELDFAKGVTIGSVLHTDEHSHLEPISMGKTSSAWRLFLAPQTDGKTLIPRIANLLRALIKSPKSNLKVFFKRNWSQSTLYLLFMQHLDSTLSFKLGKGGFMKSTVVNGEKPSYIIPESRELTKQVEKIVDGKASAMSAEILLGSPSTAHILGGSVMGESKETGVINDKNQVYGYQNMYVCDGSAVSANPGVNPALSITAITEWAMSHIPEKSR